MDWNSPLMGLHSWKSKSNGFVPHWASWDQYKHFVRASAVRWAVLAKETGRAMIWITWYVNAIVGGSQSNHQDGWSSVVGQGMLYWLRSCINLSFKISSLLPSSLCSQHRNLRGYRGPQSNRFQGLHWNLCQNWAPSTSSTILRMAIFLLVQWHRQCVEIHALCKRSSPITSVLYIVRNGWSWKMSIDLFNNRLMNCKSRIKTFVRLISQYSRYLGSSMAIANRIIIKNSIPESSNCGEPQSFT